MSEMPGRFSLTARAAALPATLFAIPMGLSGLAGAWGRATVALGWPAGVSDILMVVAAFALLVVSALYAGKLLLSPGAVRDEWCDPVRANLIPGLTISLMLIGTWSAAFAPTIGEATWLAGAVGHLCLAVMIVRNWFVENFQITQVNPSMFVPVAALAVAPVGGVAFGYIEMSWFFLSVAAVFWLILLPVVFNRILFHDPLPAEFVPTLFVLIAPPALVCSAYFELNDMVLDGWGRALLFVALFLSLLLAAMARTFLRVPFSLAWWAYTFPTAALASACLIYHTLNPNPFTFALAAIVLGLATLIVAAVAWRTVWALLNRTLIAPPGS